MNNQQYSAKHIRRMKLFERQHLKAVYTALEVQITPVAETMRSKGIEAAMASLDTVEINAALAPPIRDIYKTVGLYFANKTIWDLNQSAKRGELKSQPSSSAIGYADTSSETKAAFGFNEEFIRDILAFFNQFLLNQAVLPISETTKNQILQIISEGVQKGWGADKIADALQSPELMMWRARLIVRTESNKAMNYGQRLGESKSEWESTKTWIAANDHRTRHSHRLVDDLTLNFSERFMVPIYKGGKVQIQVGVDLMTGPGDVHAHAANICNCRCTLAFAAKRDENGRLIRKPSVSPIFVKAAELNDDEMTKEQIAELFREQKAEINQMIISVKNETIFHREKVLKRIGEFEQTFQAKSADAAELKSAIGNQESELVALIKSKDIKDEESIDNLINLINSKEYNPEIKLKTDSLEVINAVQDMRAELIVFLRGLKEELTGKKRIISTVERDENDLIKTVTSITV